MRLCNFVVYSRMNAFTCHIHGCNSFSESAGLTIGRYISRCMAICA